MTALLDAPITSTTPRLAAAVGAPHFEVKAYLTRMQEGAAQRTDLTPTGDGYSPELMAGLEQERLMAWRQNLAKIRQACASQ